MMTFVTPTINTAMKTVPPSSTTSSTTPTTTPTITSGSGDRSSTNTLPAINISESPRRRSSVENCLLSLEVLYDDPYGRIIFKKYLKKSKITESFLFLEAVEDYTRFKSSHNRYMLITSIMDQFIKANARRELNLSQPCKARLINRVKNECSVHNCPQDLFNECVFNVIKDLKEDVWPRFVRTPEFQKYLTTWQEVNGAIWTTGQEMMTLCGFDVSTPFFKEEDFDRVTSWVKGNFIENTPWKLAVKKRDYTVYLSEYGIKADSYSDRAVKSWKIEGKVAVPIEILAQCLVSTPLRIQTDGNLKAVTPLDFLTSDDNKYAVSITHEEYDMGRLVTDRDYVISQSFRSETYGTQGLRRVVLIRKTVEHEKAPKSAKKPIRADAIACFYLEELDAHNTRYYEVGWIDLKGSIPMWLWDAIIKRRGGAFHNGLLKRYKAWKAAERTGKLEELDYLNDAGIYATLKYYEDKNLHQSLLWQEAPQSPTTPKTPKNFKFNAENTIDDIINNKATTEPVEDGSSQNKFIVWM